MARSALRPVVRMWQRSGQTGAVTLATVHAGNMIGWERHGQIVARRSLVAGEAALSTKRLVAGNAVAVRRAAEGRSVTARCGVLVAANTKVPAMTGDAVAPVDGDHDPVGAPAPCVGVIAGWHSLVTGRAALLLIVAQATAVAGQRTLRADNLPMDAIP